MLRPKIYSFFVFRFGPLWLKHNVILRVPELQNHIMY
jgi:hypothetical protein